MAAPTFSVILPTHRRTRQLERCLAAVAALDYPHTRFEVIVVDDGGELSVEPIAGRLSEGISLRVVRQTRAGPAAARNRGATTAEGEVLAFTDDDCLPTPGWLSELAKTTGDWAHTAVGGRVTNALPGNPCSEASQLVTDALYGHLNADPLRARFFLTSNLALSRHAFLSMGGFDTRFTRAAGEDRDFCERWLGAGGRLIFAPAASVAHEHRLTLRSLSRQHFDYGRGASTLYEVRRERGEQGLRSGRGLHRRLLLTTFRHREGLERWRLLGLVSLTQGAYAAGFAIEERRRRRTGGRPPGATEQALD